MLTLGLGIGAATSVFSVIDAVLLHPVPYPDPDRIVSVLAVRPERSPDRTSLTPADFLSLRSQTFHGDSLEGVIQMGAGDPAMMVHMAAKRTGDCK